MKKWNNIKDINPSDTLLEVKDVYGIIGKAIPTYYSFDIKNDEDYHFEEEKWDGNWMELCDDFTFGTLAEITHWREL